MPVSGPLPKEWETYQLVRIGLSVAEADEIAWDRAQELLAIHQIAREKS